LLNSIWKPEDKNILLEIIDKIEWLQYNPSVVTEEDIMFAKQNKKLVILKYPLYRGEEKKGLDKIIYYKKI